MPNLRTDVQETEPAMTDIDSLDQAVPLDLSVTRGGQREMLEDVLQLSMARFQERSQGSLSMEPYVDSVQVSSVGAVHATCM